MNENTTLSFTAEVIKVEVKKTASLDKEYKIVLVTENPQAMALGEFINDKTVNINVEAIA